MPPPCRYDIADMPLLTPMLSLVALICLLICFFADAAAASIRYAPRYAADVY